MWLLFQSILPGSFPASINMWAMDASTKMGRDSLIVQDWRLGLPPKLQKIKLPCRRTTTFHYCVHSWLFLQCHVLIVVFQLEIHRGNLCSERYNEGHTWDFIPRGELSAPEIFFFLTVWLVFWCQHQLLVK